MKAYDLLFLIKPNLGDDKYKSIVSDVEGYITKQGGEIDFMKPQGLKALATEFNKIRQGYYVHSQFRGDNKVLDELNNRFRVSEDIFRHMIVDLESIQSDRNKEEAKA